MVGVRLSFGEKEGIEKRNNKGRRKERNKIRERGAKQKMKEKYTKGIIAVLYFAEVYALYRYYFNDQIGYIGHVSSGRFVTY